MLTLQCHLKMSMWQTEIDRFTIQFYLEISMWQKTVIDRLPLQCHLEMNLWHRTRLKDFPDTATLTWTCGTNRDWKPYFTMSPRNEPVI